MVRGLQSRRLASASMMSWAVKLDLSPFCQKTRITSHSASEMFGGALIDYRRNLSSRRSRVKSIQRRIHGYPCDGINGTRGRRIASWCTIRFVSESELELQIGLPPADVGNWHVLHTKSRQEKIVAADLAAM